MESSNQSEGIRESAMVSHTIRAARRCTSELDRKMNIKMMYRIFTKRGYKEDQIKKVEYQTSLRELVRKIVVAKKEGKPKERINQLMRKAVAHERLRRGLPGERSLIKPEKQVKLLIKKMSDPKQLRGYLGITFDRKFGSYKVMADAAKLCLGPNYSVAYKSMSDALVTFMPKRKVNKMIVQL